MKRDLIIVGTGDYAECAALYFTEQGKHALLGFAEERAFITKASFLDQPIFPFEDLSTTFSAAELTVFVAIGPGRINTVRERIFLQCAKLGFRLESFIHPLAYVADPRSIGVNSCVFPFACVEPGARIGNNCVLWTGSHVAHHSIVGDHCFFGPGARVSGRSEIRSHCFLGINSTVRDHVVVSERCIIGAGAVIKKSTTPGRVYSAKPADLLGGDSLDKHI